MNPLLWAVVSMLLGLSFVMLEVFIPSYGILGFLAFSSLATSVVMAFLHSPLTGATFLGIMMVALPAIVVLALNIFPHTPIGKRLLLKAPDPEDVLPQDEHFQLLKGLIGKVGKARSMMLPSGAIVVDGRTVDAVSDGMAVSAGQMVKVIDVRGNRIVIRPIDEQELLANFPATTSDDLSRSADSLGLEPLDNPLG